MTSEGGGECCLERLISLLSAVPDASRIIFGYFMSNPYNILFSFVIFIFDWHVALTEF
jgi:hypothetical protein